jgi:DNA-binding transcriptional regulator YdaS (Cro superfamily)
MKLKKYIQSKPKGTQGELADSLDISRSWFSKIVNERRLPSPALAVAKSHVTEGRVKRKDLRPDIFLDRSRIM